MDFDTSERFLVKEITIDKEDPPMEGEFEVYVRDSEENSTSMITFFIEDGLVARPAVKTGDFLYGEVEEAKAEVARYGFEIGESTTVV